MTGRFRFDIQALRAVSVLLVLIFHIWPEALPAGYVGVDVFFVISGFLITGLLHRELHRDGRIDFRRFYVRRFRRLMPAASLVIAVTMLLSFMLEPAFRQPGTAMEGLASALYWQNWLLAWRATDYLDAEMALGPLTHYWSLSIEEQFYLAWPLALAAAGFLAHHRGWSLRTIALVIIGVISAASLAASGILANRGFPEVYFVTHARIWELGIGALLALIPLPGIRPAAARVLSAAALLVIVTSALTIPESAAFPGLIALLPTLSAAVFIFAGAHLDDASWFGLPASRPVQIIGDASYSIYLWHWPLIYFATLGSASPPSLQSGLGLIAAGILVGWLSRILIERPFLDRRGATGRSSPMAVAGTALCLIISVAAAGILSLHSAATINAWTGVTPGADYPGAMVLTGHAAAPALRPPRPPLAAVKEDLPVIYGRACHVGIREEKPVECVLHQGTDAGPLVVLTGDSHAANWSPSLRAAAAEADWTLISITKSACSLTLQPDNPAVRAPDHCVAWSRATLERLRALAPDLILLGRSRRGSDYESEDSDQWVPGLISMLQEVLDRLKSTTAHIAVFADTPRLPFDPPNCLANERECSTPLEASLDRPDPLLAAARRTEGVSIVDFRNSICPEQMCQAVIGNVIVWRDNHHLTATYSRSLAPAMERRLRDLLQDH